MIVKTIYECENCGQEYKSMEDADRCESMHVLPKEIVMKNIRYKSPRPYNSNSHKYPSRLKVVMDDGEIITYYMDHSDMDAEKDKNAFRI